MLNIIKEIEYWGLDAVVENYALNCKDGGHKILLKYNQIESSFARTAPAVRECRGLVLEKSTLRPMSYPFYRFFNQGEGCADTLDYSTARVYKKEDGSLIGLYWDWVLNGWAVQTSGTPDGLTPVGENLNITFRDLFLETLDKPLDGFNKDYCYVFELCTPLNIVVTPHTTAYTKVLTIRNMKTLKELSHEEVVLECERLEISQVESYGFGIGDIVEMIKEMPAVEEGYVVCDAEFRRIKIKNPAYVALHHLKGSMSKEGLFEVIFKGEVDEVLALMPNFENDILKRERFFRDSVVAVEEFLPKMITAPYATKKDFALWLQEEIKSVPILVAISGQLYRYTDRVLKGEDAVLLNARDAVIALGPEKLEKIYQSLKYE